MRMPICLDVERPLDLRWWDWTRNFPRRHSHLEQERSGDRILGWTAAPWLKKNRSDSDDMVRQKSSKKQVQTTKVTCWWSPRCWRCKFAIEEVCGPRGQDMATRTRAWACYGTPWQQLGRFRDVCSPRGAKKKVFLRTSSTVTLLEKKSRQECRTVLKLGRNIFGLSTHHSIVKKRIKKQE